MAYTTIDKPSDYFETKLYVGNESTNAITGLDFQPDWVWLKNRDTGYYHGLYDSVRGTGNTKSLYSNAAEAEGQNSGNMNLASFNSDGFTLGATSSTNIINKSSENHVSWNWKAGTSFTNDASATGIGTIDSAGSVSDTSGFSIVTYTAAGAAATIKHGLSSAPKMIFTRKLNGSPNWGVYYGDETDYLELNTTQGTQDDANMWNDTAPTSSVFSVGGDNKSSGGGNYVAYCFAEKKGYSKFGTYTGNGNADGTFVYTGFSPAMIICKTTAGTGSDWRIIDNKRDFFNVSDARLKPNTIAAEDTNTQLDFTSNGFKFRAASGDLNGTSTYIYMAFAEHPFVSSTGTPTTAR